MVLHETLVAALEGGIEQQSMLLRLPNELLLMIVKFATAVPHLDPVEECDECTNTLVVKP